MDGWMIGSGCFGAGVRDVSMNDTIPLLCCYIHKHGNYIY